MNLTSLQISGLQISGVELFRLDCSSNIYMDLKGLWTWGLPVIIDFVSKYRFFCPENLA